MFARMNAGQQGNPLVGENHFPYKAVRDDRSLQALTRADPDPHRPGVDPKVKRFLSSFPPAGPGLERPNLTPQSVILFYDLFLLGLKP